MKSVLISILSQIDLTTRIIHFSLFDIFDKKEDVCMKCMKFVIKDENTKSLLTYQNMNQSAMQDLFNYTMNGVRQLYTIGTEKNMGKNTLECLIFTSKALLSFRTILPLIRH